MEHTPEFFLSALSHEIRTPLNGIVGYCQLLSHTKLDATQQMYISNANRCAIQLVEIVNDVLDFSKLSMGKGTINEECFSIKEVVEEVNSVLSQPLKEKKQKLKYILEPDLPEFITSDRQKIIQILINLISNASKFTPIKGRIIVNIIPQPDCILEFHVEDNGIGISEENQRKLFQPFVQINPNGIGNGLGLAICKKLVQLLGGDIVVSSEPNKGSIFSFSIKYKSIEKLEKQIEKNSEILKNTFMLVVDDNIDNRLFLSEMLFEYDVKVISCGSAKEAIKILPRYPFVVGLLDICMPEISGITLANQIKEKNPDMPLIALSSVDEGVDTKVFDKIINKPINKIKLLDILCNIVKKTGVDQFDLTEKKEEKSSSEIKILIAEDIGYNQEMLIKMLTSMGYTNITLANDGKETIEKLEGNTYDILLLDLKMPNVDGFGVASYIKEKNIENLKIAVISASVLENDKARCKELGIKYFLLKPFNMSHLKHIMNRLINGTI